MYASDVDSGEFGSISYEILAVNDLFAIDSGGGVIRVVGMLDRETSDQYGVTVLARDGGKTLVGLNLVHLWVS